ncbi:MAG: response regulator transcription factor [Myxococcota bacterium]
MDTVVVVTRDLPRENPVVRSLREAGWRVLLRRPGPEVDEVAVDQPDLVIVDVPEERPVRAALRRVLDAPGLEEIPVMAAVAEASVGEAGRIPGLSDFVVKPLRAGELAARARRPLALGPRDEEDRILLAGLLIDLKGFEVSVDGAILDLTYQEFQLLKFLASNPGQAFTRDQLLARVWGYDYYGGSRTVDIHVRRIRAKLGQPYASCIQTIRHVGYKWDPRYAEPSDEGSGSDDKGTSR